MDFGRRTHRVVPRRVTAYIIFRKGFFVVLRRRRVLGLVTVLVLALLLAACGGGGNKQQSSSSSSSQTSSATTTSAQAREISVVLGDFSFEPQEIRVKSGERVKLVIKNEGSVAHDWHVDALNLSTPLVAAGQSATFEFTAGAAGTYDSYCAEPGHDVLGMVGKLIIE